FGVGAVGCRDDLAVLSRHGGEGPRSGQGKNAEHNTLGSSKHAFPRSRNKGCYRLFCQSGGTLATRRVGLSPGPDAGLIEARIGVLSARSNWGTFGRSHVPWRGMRFQIAVTAVTAGYRSTARGIMLSPGLVRPTAAANARVAEDGPAHLRPTRS